DGPQDAEAVAPGAELRQRALRPRVIGRLDLGHGEAELKRVYGQLGLDLEARGQQRERLDEAAREHAVARQHVGEAAAEHVGDEAGQEPVAGAMAGAVGGLGLLDARAHDHVAAVPDQAGDQARRARRVVGGVAVDQDVDVGLDVGEHAAHDKALALPRLAEHLGAGRARHRDRVVGRVVVVDEDRGGRQRRAEVAHDPRDRDGLVVARHQHGDAIAAQGAPIRFRRTFSHRPIPPPAPIAYVARQPHGTNALAGLTRGFYAREPCLNRSPILAVVVPFEHPRSATLNRLVDLVAADMERVNAAIVARTGSEVTMIPEVANHLISSGGKRLRPMLTIAMAKLAGYTGDGHIKLAAAVEFMHTATLLHDDVVDESDMRRGKLAARMVWGNEASVLVGDFLLGQAFRMMVEVGSLHALDILSSAATVIAEGEVMQLGTAKNTATNEDEYLAVIRGKTAELFAAACEVGPALASKEKAEQAACRSFGMNLGIAFQLVDDALDYGGKSAKLG